MDSQHLTSAQLEQLSHKVAGIVAYLHALEQRMERRGFPPDDELYRLVCHAYEEAHHLRVKLHYLWCDKTRRHGNT